MSERALWDTDTMAEEVGSASPPGCGYCHRVLFRSTQLAEEVLKETIDLEYAQELLGREVLSNCMVGRSLNEAGYSKCGWGKS